MGERNGWRTRPTLAALAVLAVAGCTSTASRSDGFDSSSGDLRPPPAILVVQDVLDAADEACSPEGRDRLYADADTRDPAAAAQWYADQVDSPWQVLAEEACYLALVSTQP